jgi:hypothetical protein
VSAAVNPEAVAPGASAPPVTAPVEAPGGSPHAASPATAPVPEPTGPGTAVAAQEQLKASEKPPTSLLTEGAPTAETPETPAAEAPEAFDPEKITFPEGTAPDKELLGKFGEIAKAHGLTQPAAQQLVDLYNTVAKTQADANRTAWNSTLASWETEVREDKGVIGKATLKGENGTTLQGLEAVKVTVARVINNPELTDPKFREALEVTGIGSNPAAVRTLYQWAKALTEGSAVRAGGPSPNVGARSDTGPQTAARALYPNLP